MATYNISQARACTPETSSIPTLFGAEILDVSVISVTNYTYPILEGWRYTQPSLPVAGVDFCNVTATYTHPGQNDPGCHWRAGTTNCKLLAAVDGLPVALCSLTPVCSAQWTMATLQCLQTQA
jgi:hypothetical protein